MLVGPNCSALTGSMSPNKSSTVKSGLPCTRTNLSSPVTFAVFCFFSLHSGHSGCFGSQWYWHSFRVNCGSSLAMFFASVVLPMPGGPSIIRCLSISRALFSWCFVLSCPRMSVNGSVCRNTFWKCSLIAFIFSKRWFKYLTFVSFHCSFYDWFCVFSNFSHFSF